MKDRYQKIGTVQILPGVDWTDPIVVINKNGQSGDGGIVKFEFSCVECVDHKVTKEYLYDYPLDLSVQSNANHRLVEMLLPGFELMES